MDYKTQVLLVIFFSFILGVFVSCFNQYVILKDYYVLAQADCDPDKENCFIYECVYGQDFDCPADPEDRVSYYKLVKKKAFYFDCEIGDNCDDFSCKSGEDCQEILCGSGGENEEACSG